MTERAPTPNPSPVRPDRPDLDELEKPCGCTTGHGMSCSRDWECEGCAKARKAVAYARRLEAAAKTFAEAWAAWHDHSGLMLDDNLITASNGILDAMGLELVEEDGKHMLGAATPGEEGRKE